MDWNEAKDWALKLLATGIVGYACKLLNDLVKSVNELNIKIAVILEHLNNHDERISRLENKP